MKKKLEYYMSLNYPVEILKIPEDEGGGYSVCIPRLGRKAFIADGDTIDEALQNLDALKEESFIRRLEKNIPIPNPEPEKEDEEFSGKFLIRVPKELHKMLVENAKHNDSSLNQYVQYIITTGLAVSTFKEAVDNQCAQFEKVINDMKSVEYNIDQKNIYQEYRSQGLHLIASEKKFSKYPLAG